MLALVLTSAMFGIQGISLASCHPNLSHVIFKKNKKFLGLIPKLLVECL